MYNQQPAPRCNTRDPMVLNDIDECTEQLEGQVDDNDNEDEGNDLIFMMIPLLIGHLFMKFQALESQEFIQGEKQKYYKRQPSCGDCYLIFPCFQERSICNFSLSRKGKRQFSIWDR